MFNIHDTPSVGRYRLIAQTRDTSATSDNSQIFFFLVDTFEAVPGNKITVLVEEELGSK